jgi:DNA-binding transcriptional LysR family regulator
MIQTESMAVFAEVADAGSFVGAARSLNRSPASVTRVIADLETQLGVRLLNRTTRAVSLTEAGQRLLTGAKRVLADLSEIEQAAAGQASAPRGELAVTAPIVFGRKHVLPLVTEFLAQYPEMKIRLALTDRSSDLIEDGLDAAVRIGELPSSSAVATRVGAVRRVVVASPDYLKRRGEPKTPADLADHDTIAFAALDGIDRWRFRTGKGSSDGAIRPRLVVNTAEAAIDAAESGFGITRVLCYQVADALERKSLVRILGVFEEDAVPIHVLYPQGRHTPPKLRAFLDVIVPRLRARCDAVARQLEAL